ncbi:hypothetical protein [Streptomyces sp. H27-S2]|uniref:hypothetical protein n=1 Tax=Streptomyces antarcticus TaxID=2996458 RepID=UPI00226F270C|nr:hypothetical protein [Streptomyces sp. H27-S2]MCY0948729.1 hypothetical protein [Streptomyces sp. H27-S2]
MIDAAGGRYFSVDVLREMKREHEAAVDRNMERSLGGGEEAAERTSRFIGEWSRRVDLDEWDAWTSSLLVPSPVIDRDRFDRYSATVIWLSNRAWPTSHFSGVQRAVKIFADVWRDLIGVIDREFAYHRNMRDRFCLREKHKEIDWDEKLYKQYGDEFDFLVDLIHELVYHATAAANLICDRVRDEVDYGYRFDEGRISVTRGPNEFLRFEHFRPSYADEHRLSGDPYPGLTGVKKFVVETYGHRL